MATIGRGQNFVPDVERWPLWRGLSYSMHMNLLVTGTKLFPGRWVEVVVVGKLGNPCILITI